MDLKYDNVVNYIHDENLFLLSRLRYGLRNSSV